LGADGGRPGAGAGGGPRAARRVPPRGSPGAGHVRHRPAGRPGTRSARRPARLGADARERRGRADRGPLGLPPGAGLPVVPGVGPGPRCGRGGPAAGMAGAGERRRGGWGTGQRRAVGGGRARRVERGVALRGSGRGGRPAASICSGHVSVDDARTLRPRMRAWTHQGIAALHADAPALGDLLPWRWVEADAIHVLADGSLGLAWRLPLLDAELLTPEQREPMARAFDGLLARLPAGVAFQVVLVSEPGRSRRLTEWMTAPDGRAPLLH